MKKSVEETGMGPTHEPIQVPDPSVPEQSVAGYIRQSVVPYPSGCTQGDAKNAYLASLMQRRRAELRQMAESEGRVIELWYADLGISGRGKHLTDRTGFEALTLAARTGVVGEIFVLDLSRLFRNLVQQELWLTEMEQLGVILHIGDLPFAIDAPTRRLLRQQIGLINEYQSERVGTVISASLSQRVAQGVWVGRSYSQWGLRYDAGIKGFVLDETTAPFIRRLYEVFNAKGGVAHQAVRMLNYELSHHLPQALVPPRSQQWDITKLLLHIRNPIYRRRTRYKGHEYDVPHLIPEVVSPDVIAATDALLSKRQAIYEECRHRCEPEAEVFLYSKRLRCAECGGYLQPHPRYGISGPAPGVMMLWLCTGGPSGRGCEAGFRLPQYRLSALVDRALRQAFAAARQASELALEHETRADRHAREARERAETTILRRRLVWKIYEAKVSRQRCLESYAVGLVGDLTALKERLSVLQARQDAAEEALEQLGPVLATASLDERWAWSKLGRLQAHFESVWPQNWWEAHDPGKAKLLSDLDLTISVRIYPRQKSSKTILLVQQREATQLIASKVADDRESALGNDNQISAQPGQSATQPGEPKKPFRPRLVCGFCKIELQSPLFGLLFPGDSSQDSRNNPIAQGSLADQTADIIVCPEGGGESPLSVVETEAEWRAYKRLLRPRLT